MGSTSPDSRESPAKERERKPYSAPKLTRYGGLAAITRAATTTGMGDGAMAGANKT
jgi:hypothetical protein